MLTWKVAWLEYGAFALQTVPSEYSELCSSPGSLDPGCLAALCKPSGCVKAAMGGRCCSALPRVLLGKDFTPR